VAWQRASSCPEPSPFPRATDQPRNHDSLARVVLDELHEGMECLFEEVQMRFYMLTRTSACSTVQSIMVPREIVQYLDALNIELKRTLGSLPEASKKYGAYLERWTVERYSKWRPPETDDDNEILF